MFSYDCDLTVIETHRSTPLSRGSGHTLDAITLKFGNLKQKAFTWLLLQCGIFYAVYRHYSSLCFLVVTLRITENKQKVTHRTINKTLIKYGHHKQSPVKNFKVSFRERGVFISFICCIFLPWLNVEKKKQTILGDEEENNCI